MADNNDSSFDWNEVGKYAAFGGVAGLVNGIGQLYNRYTAKKQLSYQKKVGYELANYEAALNYKYSQLYNRQNYQLAQMYAENSAKWAVTGLRNANLNPVLAASSGFNPNLGQAGVSSSASVSPGSPPSYDSPDYAESMRDIASLDLTSATAKQTRAQTEDLLPAQSAKLRADANLVNSQAELNRVRSRNERLNLGGSGREGLAVGILRRLWEFRDRNLKNDSRSFLHRLFNINDNTSAKDRSHSTANPSNAVEKVILEPSVRHSSRDGIQAIITLPDGMTPSKSGSHRDKSILDPD